MLCAPHECWLETKIYPLKYSLVCVIDGADAGKYMASGKTLVEDEWKTTLEANPVCYISRLVVLSLQYHI